MIECIWCFNSWESYAWSLFMESVRMHCATVDASCKNGSIKSYWYNGRERNWIKFCNKFFLSLMLVAGHTSILEYEVFSSQQAPNLTFIFLIEYLSSIMYNWINRNTLQPNIVMHNLNRSYHNICCGILVR